MPTNVFIECIYIYYSVDSHVLENIKNDRSNQILYTEDTVFQFFFFCLFFLPFMPLVTPIKPSARKTHAHTNTTNNHRLGHALSSGTIVYIIYMYE